jgi:predicted P-loop ATPase
MNDPTGGRRFWPVAIGAINLDSLRIAAPQLWAEAVHRYRQGEEWWITDPVVLEEATRAVNDRYEDDPWAAAIDEYLADRDRCTAAQVLTHAIHMDPDRQDQRAQTRVGDHLRRSGWVRKPIRINGQLVKGWMRP